MHKPLPKPVAALLALGVASSLAACSFEPKLRVPPAPSDKMAYTAGKSPVKTVTPGGMAGAAQEIQYGTELHEQWWKLFHSKALDTLISVGLKNSPTIAAAQAQMREAQALSLIHI